MPDEDEDVDEPILLQLTIINASIDYEKYNEWVISQCRRNGFLMTVALFTSKRAMHGTDLVYPLRSISHFTSSSTRSIVWPKSPFQACWPISLRA
jgi:hypothetical protein